MRSSMVRALLIFAGGVSPALASDGVIEINQAKALAGGVTPGDIVPGFPVTISVGGSYRLTGNLSTAFLDAGGVNTRVIEITASFVDLDLGGFVITGTRASGVGTGSCVFASAGANWARVRNGKLTACSGSGIDLVFGTVDDVVVNFSGVDGIHVTVGDVSRATVANAIDDGIEISIGSVSESKVLAGVQGTAIAVESGTIQSCVAKDNPGEGLAMHTGSVLDSWSGLNTGVQMRCDNRCSLGGNHFAGCVGAGCFGGVPYQQTPAGSNMCGAAICP